MNENTRLYLKDGMINKLFMLSPEEVQEVARLYPCYIPDSRKQKEFDDKATKIVDNVRKDLEDIKRYEQREYKEKIAEGNCTYEDEPAYQIEVARNDAKTALVNLIKEYYNKDYYRSHQPAIVEAPKEIDKAYTSADLYAALISIDSKVRHFFYSVGYLQWKHLAFLSWEDRKRINKTYMDNVRIMNKGWPYENDLFYYDKEVPHPPIDIDNISLINLVLPYLNTNIKELVQIADIIRDTSFGKYDSAKRYSRINELVANASLIKRY